MAQVRVPLLPAAIQYVKTRVRRPGLPVERSEACRFQRSREIRGTGWRGWDAPCNSPSAPVRFLISNTRAVGNPEQRDSAEADSRDLASRCLRAFPKKR